MQQTCSLIANKCVFYKSAFAIWSAVFKRSIPFLNFVFSVALGEPPLPNVCIDPGILLDFRCTNQYNIR